MTRIQLFLFFCVVFLAMTAFYYKDKLNIQSDNNFDNKNKLNTQSDKNFGGKFIGTMENGCQVWEFRETGMVGGYLSNITSKKVICPTNNQREETK